MQAVKTIAPNQIYFESNGKIIFQSYNTIVAMIENFEDGNEPIIKITDGQPQSRTTGKYLNKFLDITVGINDYKKVL